MSYSRNSCPSGKIIRINGFGPCLRGCINTNAHPTELSASSSVRHFGGLDLSGRYRRNKGKERDIESWIPIVSSVVN